VYQYNHELANKYKASSKVKESKVHLILHQLCLPLCLRDLSKALAA